MLHKIYFIFLFSVLLSFSLSAENNEKFADMACEFISHNRSVLHCELQQKRIVVIQTTEGKELRFLCVWFPQTCEEEHILDDTAISLIQRVDKVLIGYGQTARNPMFHYCLPAKRVQKKVGLDKLEKYRLLLSLYDYRF